MVESNVRVIIEQGTLEAPDIEKFEEKLRNLPKNIKIDVTENVDIDRLIEALDSKRQERNRNLNSYQNDIYY